MPRLSVIIPHRNDDQRLEETILSVLENRPRDCEVIVVHDGAYRDPYALGDEVVYVQEEAGSSTVDLLNAGLMAACSPVICALLDGTQVAGNWAEPALKRFAQSDVASVSPRLEVGKSVIAGISTAAVRDAASLRSGAVQTQTDAAAVPTLAAGFYRRKSLLALGGWNDEMSGNCADVELAALMAELGLRSEHESQCVLFANSATMPARKTSAAIGELASIAAAYGLASSGLSTTITSVILGALTGKMASGLAWTAGLRNEVLVSEIAERLEHAQRQLGDRQDAISVKLHGNAAAAQQRRAA